MINSPSEISVAVVPSPQPSLSPPGYHPRSPPFAFEPSVPAAKRRCFGIVGAAHSPESLYPSQQIPSPNTQFFSTSTSTNHFNVFPFEDTKDFLLGAMQQQPQMQSLAQVHTSLSPPAPRKEDYKLVINQQPEQVKIFRQRLQKSADCYIVLQ